MKWIPAAVCILRGVVALAASGPSPSEGALEDFLRTPRLDRHQLFTRDRFPNVVVARDGAVLAFWNGVKLRRSEDGGTTWGEEILVGSGFMGGGVTVDETSGDILAFVEASHPPTSLTVYRSQDHGRTWRPQETTIRPDSRGNVPSMHMNEHGITLRRGAHAGRLLRPSRWYAGKNDRALHPQHYTDAIYSDDGGRTWQASEPFPAFGTGEATLAELSDGRIYYNSRRHWAPAGVNARRRWTAWSQDGGHTWTDLAVCEALPDGDQDRDYGLMGGLVRLPIEGQDVLLFSNIESPSGRHHGTVWASFDGGKTWPLKRLVSDGPFAYSSLNAGRPGTASAGWIYLLYEAGDAGGILARFNLSWLLAGERTGDGQLPAHLTATSTPLAAPKSRRVAGLTTVYRHNSHADVILSRLLLTDMLDGTGRESPLELVSLYTDQRPPNDTSRLLAASHHFRIASNITEALTLGTGRLAVDGVLLIAEHGEYPRSAVGNTQYPKRRFWDETIAVFRASGRVVPVFIDKHLADNWADAKHIYDTARELGIPLMAGSSVPGSWRQPVADVPRGAALEEILVVSYGSTDHYGFHALECLQAVVEQRAGGETGVREVVCRSGAAAWEGLREFQVDPELLNAALHRLTEEVPDAATLRAKVSQPILWRVHYQDGLRATVIELNGVATGWSGAWRYRQDRRVESTRFWTQEARPAAHFTRLLNGVEKMILTGKPSWPVERTLMSSGLLDALLQSCGQGGKILTTDWLRWSYETPWRWQAPPPPPPSRPWGEQ